MPTIRLEPLGVTISCPTGTPLRDLLFPYGVEFPCGGLGKCRRCRIRVLEGDLPPTPEENRILEAADLAAGWRLACRAAATGNITLEIGQWQMAILADDTKLAFTPREGLGVALDIGTTTLVAQLLDLATGAVLGVRSALNPQVTHGSDVMSRIQAALEPGGRERLTSLIREATGRLVADLGRCGEVREVVAVGNTVMHHLFCGVDPEPLSHAPFRPTGDGLRTFHPAELGWPLPVNATIQFLPCLGGFVGSDILAGILACGLDRAAADNVLLDLGTNGEVVVGNRDRILCASTAAGPAFEGGRISMGMRAATGAIAQACIEADRLAVHVLGGGSPQGICGSGLVDLAAAGLDLGRILPNGRLAGGEDWIIAPPVRLIQGDVRELQLAKGAIAAGARLLVARAGAVPDRIATIYLAGAFGNYVSRESARRIGLLEWPIERVRSAGNTALLGAKIVLFRTVPDERDFSDLRARITHVPLADDPAFEDTFVDCMQFPSGA